MKRLIFGAVIALAGVGNALALQMGDLAPEASGIRIQGPEKLRLSALTGRVVIVDFWASWCAPCVDSMPKLDAMYQQLRDAGLGPDKFEILAVGLDKRTERARQFLQVHPVSYPVVVDTVGIASTNFGVWRLPATYLIDQQGRVQQIYSGFGPGFVEDLRQRIQALLKPAATAHRSEGQTPAASEG